MPRLTHDQRVQIIALHDEAGHSVQQLMRSFNCDRRTIQRLLAKHKATASVDDRPRQSRGRVSTEREDRTLVRLSSQNPRLVARQLQQTWSQHHGVHGSLTTVKRRLRSAGLYGRVAVKKPLLSARHRQRRLLWAQDHLNWTLDQWSLVCFSDESPIHYVAAAQQRYVRRRGGTAMHHQHIRPTVHSSTGKLQVWGCFTQYGHRVLVRIDERLNAAAYQDILREHLLPLELAENGMVFQQDNATCHSAATTARFLEENDVEVMPWPAQSPDLAPIENLWGYLQHRLDQREIHSMNELWLAAQEEWHSIPQEVVDNVVNSMPRRLQLCIDARGNPTRY